MLRFSNLTCAVILIFTSIAIFVSACSKSSAHLDVKNNNETPPLKNKEQNKEVQADEEQTIYLRPDSKGLKTAWQKFTSSGQYRPAKFSDMTFNEAARKSLAQNFGKDIKPSSSVSLWGDLGYKKRPAEDHLAVIVVDTTKSEPNRFGLVIFSPPQGKKNFYETNWLYKDHDLSKATVNLLSGSFSVEEYLDDGSRKGCFVTWKKARKRFECDQTRIQN